jgi:glycosyltransferase involved in cell wall biosynthesis
LDVLVAAWSEVVRERPGADLLVIGEGPERPRLKRQIDELGLHERIQMPGSAADVTPRLRSAGLFVLPSREEGMSIALLEAMALGMPIVATAIPGNQGLITGGVHGRLVPADDPLALAQAIRERWDNPVPALRQAAAARVRVVDAFSITVVARKHLDLFRKLLGKS